MGENARRDGWHFKSPDRFAGLNKSNGAHIRASRVGERKRKYTRKDRRKMEGGQQEEMGGKEANPSILPLALTFGIVASLLHSLSQGGIGRNERERERIRIYRDLPRRSLVNLYSFLYPRYEKNRATTHVDVDLPLLHAVHCER